MLEAINKQVEKPAKANSVHSSVSWVFKCKN
jgi:hypothetical protein